MMIMMMTIENDKLVDMLKLKLSYGSERKNLLNLAPIFKSFVCNVTQ